MSPILALALLLVSAGPTGKDPVSVLVAEPFSASPKALWKAAGKARRDGKPDVDVLLHEGRFVIDQEGRRVFRRRYLYWLNSQAGVESWGGVQAEFSPGLDKKPIIKARVLTGPASEHWLDPSTLSQAAAEQRDDLVYANTQRVRGPLPALRPGVLVEEVTVFEDDQPVLPRDRLLRFYVDFKPSPTHVLVEVSHPTSVPLRYRVRGFPHRHHKSVKGGVVTHRFLGSPEGTPWVPFPPPDAAHAAYVAFSTGASWDEVAAHYSALVDEAVGKEPPRWLTDGVKGKDRDDLVRHVLEAQHKSVRYASLAFGEGGVVPRSPPVTKERGYGDCKDKAVLLVAALRSRGFEAHVALLQSGFGEDVLPKMPALSGFNHAIVYVPADPARKLGERWVDPTDDSVPFGELPLEDQGRLALIAAPGQEALVRIPRAPARQNRFVRTMTIDASGSGHGLVEEQTSATGFFAHSYRRFHQRKDEAESLAAFRSLAKTRYVLDGEVPPAHPPEGEGEARDERKRSKGKRKRGKGGTKGAPSPAAFSDTAARVERVTVTTKGLRSREPVEFKVVVPRAATTYTGYADARVSVTYGVLLEHLPVPFFQKAQPGATSAGAASSGAASSSNAASGDGEGRRRLPFYTHQLHEASLVVDVKAPPGYEPVLLEPFSFEAPGFSLSHRYEATEQGVRGTARLAVTKTTFTADEVAHIRAGIEQEAIRLQEVNLELVPKPQRLAKEGRTQEAAAAWQDLLRKWPKEGLLRRGYASFLLDLGYVEEARRQTALSTTLNPNDGDAWFMLGYLYTRGLDGEEHTAGYDPAAAERAYRKAEPLVPRRSRVLLSLVRAITVDEDGKFTADRRRLDRGVALLKELPSDLTPDEKADAERLRSALYFYAGRYQDLVAEVQAGTDGRGSLAATWVIATAKLKGTDEAQALLERLRPDPAARAQLLVESRQDFAQAALYGEYAMLMRRAAPAGESPSAMLQEAQLFTDAAAAGAPTFSDEPQAFVRRVSAAMLHVGQHEELTPYTLLPDDEWQEQRKGLAGVARGLNLPRHGVEPLIAAGVDVQLLGEAKTGWLAIAKPKYGPAVGESYLVLQKTPKGLRYASVTRGFSAPLGALALSHLEKGDVARAREVLGWEQVMRGERRDWHGSWLASAEAHSLSTLAAALLATGSASRLPAIAQVSKGILQRGPSDNDVERELEGRVLRHHARLVLQERSPKEAAALAAKLDPWAKSDVELWVLRHLRIDILIAEKAYAKAMKTVDEGATKDPADKLLALKRVRILTAERRFSEATAALRQDAATSEKADLPHNQIAWMSLFTDEGASPKEALELAQRAAAATEYKDAAVLHTLACVMTENGQEREALQLVKTIERLTPEMGGVNALVRARVAQRYGLTEVADSLYDRVPPAEERDVLASYWLAEKWRGRAGKAEGERRGDKKKRDKKRRGGRGQRRR